MQVERNIGIFGRHKLAFSFRTINVEDLQFDNLTTRVEERKYD
jgi:hypothetical protein